MYFKNEKHKESFMEGLRKVNKNDRDAVSTVYLLSADSCLWRRANQGDDKKKQYCIHYARKSVARRQHFLQTLRIENVWYIIYRYIYVGKRRKESKKGY